MSYKREFHVFAPFLLYSREIFRNQLPSSNQVRGNPISEQSTSEIMIHTFPVAVPIEPFPGEFVGVLQAEVSLTDILDLVSSAKFGKEGYAYVVSSSGDLVAHPRKNLLLQRHSVGQLNQVKAAFLSSPDAFKPKAIVTQSSRGRQFSAHTLSSQFWAGLCSLNGLSKEAYEPIYASLLHTAILLFIGLGVALLATLLVRRRVVRPLEALRKGVELIRKGDFQCAARYQDRGRDRGLAEEFNEMAAHLNDAYIES